MTSAVTGGPVVLRPSRLHVGDAFRAATIGLRTRRLRAALSALGITIGIAAMVAVLGLSESSKSDLLAQIDRLGTNLVQVQAGTGIGLGNAELPDTATGMVSRIGPVLGVSAVSDLSDVVLKTDYSPTDRTGGITAKAVDPSLLATLEGSLASGRFLDEATDRYPVAVLGAVAAQRLGLESVPAATRVLVGDQWFDVVGVLAPLELHPDLDRSVLVGSSAAATYLGEDPAPSRLYVRTTPDQVDAVLGVLPATGNPENPDQVEVSRPTDALEAKAAAGNAFTSLFLGLGAVALLVGGVGIANVMVIAVLERRSEIGLRRALGATRRHVGLQFLSESLLLSAIGGVTGVALGAAVTAGYAWSRGWRVLLPPVALVGGVVAALAIGAVAGLYPAARAAKLPPTDALRSAG